MVTLELTYAVPLSQAKDSEDAAEKRESDPSSAAAAASGSEETNLIDLDASAGSAELVGNADSKEAKKISVLEGRTLSESNQKLPAEN